MSSVVQLFLLILLTISSVNSRQLTLVYTAEYIDDLVVITLQNADEESTDHVSYNYCLYERKKLHRYCSYFCRYLI